MISDTHGLFRPELRKFMKYSDLIFHAGDIGKPEVMEALRKIAPVYVVRGNVDTGEWVKPYPESTIVEFDGHSFYILHNLNDLDFDPASKGFSVVVTGHSHKPKIFTKNNVLYLNPGSAGPRRFELPIGIGRLIISGNRIEAEVLQFKADEWFHPIFNLRSDCHDAVS